MEHRKKSASTLFRKEVFQSKKSSFFGKTLIVTPISFSVWTVGILLIILSLGMFIFFGEYSKRQSVQGFLVPDKGLIAIYAMNSGVIVNKFIKQGDEVGKGQILYFISTEKAAASTQSFSAQELSLLERQIELQKTKIAAYGKKSHEYDRLFKMHIITEPEYLQRVNELLNAKIALYDYEKDINAAKETAYYAIRAPVDGVISISIANAGDYVVQGTLLGSIIPKNSKLEGQLFVPTSKAGFIKLEQKILLKYYAYPYQRFGLYEATISSIDKSVVNPQDVKLISTPIKMDEAYYRVTIDLKKQTVNVYDKPYPLAAGMIFDAVILGDKRKIWQWIFDSFYNC